MPDSTKTFVFGNDGQNTFDPNLLLGMMMGGGGFGGFGGGANWWPLFLIALWGGNGMFGGWGGNGCGAGRGVGFLSNQINEDTGRQLVMQAINGVDSAVGQLANALNCSTGDIQNALCAIQGKISEVANQVGMSSQAVINAINSGNCALANQLSQCCCDLKGVIADTNANLTRGFADVGYALRDQTCNIEKLVEASTNRVVEGQRAAEMREMQREMAAKDAKIAEQAVIINNAQQTSAFGQMIAQATNPILGLVQGIRAEIDEVKCKLPKTATVPSPEGVLIPACAAAQFGLGLGFPGGSGFWF